jgi:hypothetical protein
MALVLKSVSPMQGARWVRDGFRLFVRAPLAFTALLLAFLLLAFVLALFPLVGGLAMLVTLPLLSLGFMVGSEAALAGRPVHVGAFLLPFRGKTEARRALVQLGLGYAAATVLIMGLSDWVDGGAFDQLQRLLARGRADAEIDALLAADDLAQGMLVRFSLIALLSVPFWHAPALVHWGGQAAAQALFSSTLALWRNKGAFIVYSLTWAALVVVFAVSVGLVGMVLGSREFASFLVMPGVLVISTAFYVSLLFTFNDCFGPGSTGVTEVPAAPKAD